MPQRRPHGPAARFPGGCSLRRFLHHPQRIKHSFGVVWLRWGQAHGEKRRAPLLHFALAQPGKQDRSNIMRMWRKLLTMPPMTGVASGRITSEPVLLLHTSGAGRRRRSRPSSPSPQAQPRAVLDRLDQVAWLKAAPRAVRYGGNFACCLRETPSPRTKFPMAPFGTPPIGSMATGE